MLLCAAGLLGIGLAADLCVSRRPAVNANKVPPYCCQMSYSWNAVLRVSTVRLVPSTLASGSGCV